MFGTIQQASERPTAAPRLSAIFCGLRRAACDRRQGAYRRIANRDPRFLAFYQCFGPGDTPQRSGTTRSEIAISQLFSLFWFPAPVGTASNNQIGDREVLTFSHCFIPGRHRTEQEQPKPDREFLSFYHCFGTESIRQPVGPLGQIAW